MMIFRMQWPGMPQEQVLKQIELLGREVIPQVAHLVRQESEPTCQT